ncbi:unnamed protein product, partial [Rotaria sp. Silwood1]
MNERRFHESLLMALGWISLKWLFNNYNHFCDLLISYPTECVLPLGTLLLFDALKYIHNLPSKEVIFKAFNNLLDHPSKLISQKYLKSSQLPIELIVEWMQLNITNEKRLFKFCRCLLHSECRSYITSTENTLETVSPRLFQQLWSLRKISQTAELVIDQTLHEIMKFYETPDHIFENKLYSYLLSQNICSFNIHPLIFSVILALCGGLHFTCKENIAKVQFSPKTMHRESSMIEPIIEYLVNIEQSHSIKVQTLIEKYESVLQKTLPKDISSEIIDTFIALICLRDVSKPSIQYLEVQFEYRHCITPQQQNNNILQMTEYTPFDLLVFVPQSLQQLFYRLIISPIDKRESLPLIMIGKKFNENSIDKQNQESAYVALRMLNDINPSYYLSKFEKQTINLSDLLHFNSTIFFHYFSDKSSFDSSDITLLSSMYLIELSADIQILEMYMNKIQQKKISPLEELDQLWKDPLKYKEIMTIEVANWITKYLELSNREYIDGIIERVSSCCIVEETAYEIIHTWRVYRTDKDLKFFAYYAVLFCIEDNSIEILNEMFDTHNYLHLKNVIKNWLELESVTSSFVSNILIPIIQGAYRILMHTSAYIRCKEILDLLLTMEQERILSAVSNRSILSVVRSCSKNLQPYLIQHLQDFNIKNQFENTIKEQYLITIIKWIILESIDTNNTENMSIEVYECIITFLHDQQIPLVQTMIANGINGILISDRANKGHVFIRDDLKKQLEDIIDKTNIDREDLLAACLLAYGNCLLKFNYLEMNQNVSIEIQNLLEQVSLMSSSEIISARALLCSLFSKNGN